MPVSFLSAVRINEMNVLLLGGSRNSSEKSLAQSKSAINLDDKSNTSSQPNKQLQKPQLKTSHVYLLNLINPSIERLKDLSEPFVSMYPPFLDPVRNIVTMFSEDCTSEKPTVLTYSLAD